MKKDSLSSSSSRCCQVQTRQHELLLPSHYQLEDGVSAEDGRGVDGAGHSVT